MKKTSSEKESEKKVLRAFERAVGREEQVRVFDEVRGGETLFMNKTRQEIFQYLCQYPCSHFSLLARGLNLTISTAKWHLRRLEKKGIIVSKKMGNKLVYFPAEMLNAEHLRVFQFLNKSKARRIYALISEKPGMVQKDIISKVGINGQTFIWYASQFEELGLTVSMEDGVFKRYYPTNLLDKIQDANMKRLKKFRIFLLKQLEADGVAPEVVRTTDKELHVKITTGTDRSVLVFHTNPVGTILAKAVT